LHPPYFPSLVAKADGKIGQIEKGLAVLSEALDTGNKSEERNWEAEFHRHKGELLLMQQGQNAGEAEECFRQALEITRRQQAKPLELRAAMSLSRRRHQQ
jgi:predicted ATPase